MRAIRHFIDYVPSNSNRVYEVGIFLSWIRFLLESFYCSIRGIEICNTEAIWFQRTARWLRDGYPLHVGRSFGYVHSCYQIAIQNKKSVASDGGHAVRYRSACSKRFFSSTITTSTPTSRLAKCGLICSTPYPAAMITLLTMDLGRMRIECSIKVVSNKGTSGLGTERVHGLRHVPNPPANTIASMMKAESRGVRVVPC